jgi:hypothetical protein
MVLGPYLRLYGGAAFRKKRLLEKTIDELRASEQEYCTRITIYVRPSFGCWASRSDTPVTQCIPSRALYARARARDEAGRFPSSLNACARNIPPLLVALPILALHPTQLRAERSTRAE